MSGKHRAAPDPAPVDAEGFHRVHRATPLLRFWSVILALITIFLLNFNAEMIEDIATYLRGGHWSDIGFGSLIALGGFLALCALIWFVSAIWWRKLGYRLDPDEIALRHGVLSTSFRAARYDRIQAVDVVENVIARIFGLAAVRVETAGGRNSVIQVAYLKKEQADNLRRAVLARVHDRGVVDAPASPLADAAEIIPAETLGAPLVEEVPIRRTLAAEALRLSSILGVGFVIALLFTPTPTASIIPIAVGIIPSVWGLVDKSWRFVAFHDPDKGVLNLSYGLADRRRQSIRLSRIHGVKVVQPTLWRLFGWYEVHVSVAGYGAASGGKESGSTRILPVGTRAQAMEVYALVSDLTAEEIEEFARPEGHTRPTYVSPKRAWWASPVDRARQSVTLLDGPRPVAITHEGFFARRVMVVGTSHIQELTYKAGPLSQLLRVGAVRLEMVAGPVRMAARELDPADARELMDRLRRRELPALQVPESGEYDKLRED